MTADRPEVTSLNNHLWILLGLAALSGLLLFVSDYPLHLWPLQALALLPLLIGLLRYCHSKKAALLAGLTLGAVSLVPMAVMLEFPVLMAAGLGIYLTLIWVLITLGLYLVLRWPAPLGALCAGAVAVGVEWIDFHALPVWGTAQTFARVWTAGPWAIQFVDLGGVLGLVFVLVAVQALLAQLIVNRGQRLAAAAALLVLLGSVGAYNAMAWSSARSAERTLKVAAIGWTWDDLPGGWRAPAPRVFREVYLPRVERAVKAGAKLIVSPEVGFNPTASGREALMADLSALAKKHAVMLAAGYFHRGRNDNRIAFFDADGKLVAEYVKTHLIPFMENYSAGTGELTVVQGPRAGGKPVLVGGMICQDDNFTDLSRGYGEAGVQVLAVPTNDWAQVKHYHLENSLFRAVESRYGVVRAASNGISAIVAPSGEVLARADHFEAGAKVIVADLPIVESVTLYSFKGEWLVLASLLLLPVAYGVGRRRARGARRG